MTLPDGYSDVPAGKIASVVTHLEMTARPALRPETAGALTLCKIETPPLDWFSRLQMADADLAAVLHSPLVDVYALVSEGSDEGLLELDFRTPGECELAFFGVSAKLTGGSAGRWMMNRAIEFAWSRSIRRFWVHTCTLDHPAALGFYQRSGFRPFRRQIEIEDDPRLSGLLPRHVAGHVPIIE